MERDCGATRSERFDERHGRRLALVGDVGLVRHAEEQDRRSVERFPVGVEDILGPLHDVRRHGCVDLLGPARRTGTGNPTRPARSGGGIRVDRDAMASDAGPG